MNKYIFIQSYPPFKIALKLLAKFHTDFKCTIFIFENNSLFHFFKSLNHKFFNNQIDVIFIPAFKSSLPYPIKSFFHKRYLNETYKTFFSDIRDSDIYFISKEYTDHQYYILDKLKKINKLCHIPDPGCDVYKMSDGKPSTLLEAVRWFHLMFIFGKDIRIGNPGREGVASFYKISDKFYDKYINTKFTKLDREELLSDLAIDNYSFSTKYDYDVLYVDKEMITTNLSNPQQLKKELDEIFKVILKYFNGKKIGKKFAGIRSSDQGKEMINEGFALDDSVPVELFYGEKVKLYLGVTSTGLANIESGFTISIAYLINYKDVTRRDNSVANQERRKKNKIYYPKDLKELDTLLAEKFKLK